MNDQELQRLTQELSLRYFERPFVHQINFNHRLRTTGGRYILRTGNIDINYRVYDLYGYDELVSVIKHELCHYHLHQQGKSHQHRDQAFKDLLSQVGGARYVKPLIREQERPYKYRLVCRKCGQEYFRKRRMDLRKHRCGKCYGKLQ